MNGHSDRAWKRCWSWTVPWLDTGGLEEELARALTGRGVLYALLRTVIEHSSLMYVCWQIDARDGSITSQPVRANASACKQATNHHSVRAAKIEALSILL